MAKGKIPDLDAKVILNCEPYDFNSDEDNSIEAPCSDSETTYDCEESYRSENASLPSCYDVSRQTIDAATLKVKRLRANDRERRRVNLINSAMEMLRKVIPELRERRKITKLELLRSANKYIWTLQQSLLTGRSISEVQQALSFYQINGPVSASSYFSYEYAYGYHYQNAAPQ